MSDARWTRIDRLFQEALNVPRSERPGLLDRLCGDDGEVREKVEQLVRLAEEYETGIRTGGALPDTEWQDLAAGAAAAERVARSGDRVGNFELVRRLGEGGMGSVWLADQTEPVKRQVAIKLIRPGMATRESLGRFQSERQALAMMDHPNVARVFEAGVTDDGRPYFAMEHVPGHSIVDHCNREGLGVEERLRLFISVCEAVQHAHRKAILHRDLKPSNILVTTIENRPVVKIIDFGVAKAMAPLADQTQHTVAGQIVGTPSYMSPEQADSTSDDLDTRVDVYALGAVLYELLTGCVALDPEEAAGLPLEQLLRRIREVDAPRMSERLGALRQDRPDRLAAIAAERDSTPGKLIGRLRGDLDWIVRKAMEKDRGDRYGSPEELADDLQRSLNHEPVRAGAPTTLYLARKFVRRHTLAVTAAGTLAILLVTFAVAMAVQAQRVARERDRASAEAETSRRVTEFLTRLFEISSPDESRGNSVTVREVLDRGAREIEASLETTPEIRARLLLVMGEAYYGLGIYDEAEKLLLAAADVPVHSPEDAIRQVTAESRWTNVLWRRGEYVQADSARVAVIGRQRDLLGPDHRETLRSLTHLALIRRDLGNPAEGESLLEVSAARLSEAVGPTDHQTLRALSNLSRAYLVAGETAAAESVATLVLDRQVRTLGADHPQTLETEYNVAEILWRTGRLEESKARFDSLVAAHRRVHGPDHPSTLYAELPVAILTGYLGDLREAGGLLKESLERHRRILGPEHLATLMTLNSTAVNLLQQGRHADAIEYLEEADRANVAVNGEDHPHTLGTRSNLAYAYVDVGRLADADSLCGVVLAGSRRVLGDEHPRTHVARIDVAVVSLRRGDRERALGQLEALAEAGYRAEDLATREEFEALHGEPRFDAVVERVTPPAAAAPAESAAAEPAP